MPHNLRQLRARTANAIESVERYLQLLRVHPARQEAQAIVKELEWLVALLRPQLAELDSLAEAMLRRN